MNIEIMAGMLDALGNPTRLRIFHLLSKAGDGGMPVGALVVETGIPGSTMSHHISRLTRAGLVSQERQATTLVCRAEAGALSRLSSYLDGLQDRIELGVPDRNRRTI